jgi:arsenate reductase-like glutaredoxin family protein
MDPDKIVIRLHKKTNHTLKELGGVYYNLTVVDPLTKEKLTGSMVSFLPKATAPLFVNSKPGVNPLKLEFRGLRILSVELMGEPSTLKRFICYVDRDLINGHPKETVKYIVSTMLTEF